SGRGDGRAPFAGRWRRLFRRFLYLVGLIGVTRRRLASRCDQRWLLREELPQILTQVGNLLGELLLRFLQGRRSTWLLNQFGHLPAKLVILLFQFRCPIGQAGEL